MRFNDAVIGLLLIIFGAAVLVHTQGFPTLEKGYPGPSLFPNVLAVLFIFAGLILSCRGFRSGRALAAIDRQAFGEGALRNILLVPGAILAYIFLSDTLGFLIITFTILLLMMKLLQASLMRSLITSAGITLGIYLFFGKTLLVALPWGLWGW